MQNRLLPLFSLIITMLGLLAPSASARDGSARDNSARDNSIDVKIQLVASTAFSRGKAEVEFRSRRGEQEFQVEVEVSPRLAGSVFIVSVDHTEVGEITINGFGEAHLSLNSRHGDVVPAIVRGTAVEIIAPDGSIAFAGRF